MKNFLRYYTKRYGVIFVSTLINLNKFKNFLRAKSLDIKKYISANRSSTLLIIFLKILFYFYLCHHSYLILTSPIVRRFSQNGYRNLPRVAHVYRRKRHNEKQSCPRGFYDVQAIFFGGMSTASGTSPRDAVTLSARRAHVHATSERCIPPGAALLRRLFSSGC